MNILVACEYSGIVSTAFLKRGHTVTSCDLLPREFDLFEDNDFPNYTHFQGDVFKIIGGGYDMMIGHPPCTFLSYAATGVWNAPGREEKREDALRFFKALLESPIDKICLENPLGYASTYKKYDQIVHPWMFGEPYNKRTCLWLKNLQPLVAGPVVKPLEFFYPNGKKKVCTDLMSSGNSGDRRKHRSKFWKGIATAMAEQWG